MSPELFLLGVITLGVLALVFCEPAKPARPDDGEYWIRYTWFGRPVFLAANQVTFASEHHSKKGKLELNYNGQPEGCSIVITDPAEIDAALDALGLDRSEVFKTEGGAK